MTILAALLPVLLAARADAAAKRVEVPGLPGIAIPAAPAVGIAAVDVGAPAAAVGAQAVSQSVSAAAKDVAPSVEAARRGDGADAAAAGRDMQAVLETGKAAKAPAALDAAFDASTGLTAAFNHAYAGASAAAKKESLPKPRFVAAWREHRGWQLHFSAGGRHVSAFVADSDRAAPRAWVGGDFGPGNSLGVAGPGFSRKIARAPREAIELAAERFGVPADKVGFSAGALPKSRDVWFIADTEDGRQLAFNAATGKTRELDPGPGRDRVEAAARALAGHKGYPYSQSEYNAAYHGYVGSLKQDGATRAQLALFSRLMAETPVRGGRFNSWSGD